MLSGITGCEAPGVGDPCTPENVPDGGFVGSESFLELSSLQCRTRVCIVYRLDGDPRLVVGDPACDEPGVFCTDRAEINERVFCTCRCDGPDNTSKCSCPGGFTCAPIFEQGGEGVQGSYCIRSQLIEDELP